MVVTVVSLFYGQPEFAYRMFPAWVWWRQIDQGNSELGVALCLRYPQRGIVPLVKKLQEFEPQDLAVRIESLRVLRREEESRRAKGLPAIPVGRCGNGTYLDEDPKYWPQRTIAKERLLKIAQSRRPSLPEVAPLLENPLVRNNASTILSVAGGASMPFFEEALRSADPETRKVAIRGLADMSFAPARAYELVLGAMKDSAASVRLAALLHLGRTGEAGVRALEAATSDPDPEVSVTAQFLFKKHLKAVAGTGGR